MYQYTVVSTISFYSYAIYPVDGESDIYLVLYSFLMLLDIYSIKKDIDFHIKCKKLIFRSYSE